MIKTFTQVDLIRFLYHETTPEQHREIELALLCDSELMEEFDALKDTIESLNIVRENPANSTVEAILNYSKSTNLHAAH